MMEVHLRMCEIQDKHMFKKRFSNQVPSILINDKKDRVPNPKPQGGKGGGLESKKPNFDKSVKKHMGKCLVVTNNCFGFG